MSIFYFNRLQCKLISNEIELDTNRAQPKLSLIIYFTMDWTVDMDKRFRARMDMNKTSRHELGRTWMAKTLSTQSATVNHENYHRFITKQKFLPSN